jgi:hypothetical protein
MEYTNLLGEVIDTYEVNKKNKVNPMVKAYGAETTGARCKKCTFFIRKHFSKTYFKCAFRGDTNGAGTDHKANWPACTKFEPADYLYYVTGTSEGAHVYASSEGEARRLFHKKYNGQTIIQIKKA